MAVTLNEFLRTLDRSSLAKVAAAAEAKRKALVKKFPANDWPTLPLDHYALGTPKFKDSFCYQMEYVSDELGSIAGGSADKHLIYWNGDTSAWKFESKRYQNVESAWDAVRAGFVEALRLGAAGKFEEIDAIESIGAARVLRAKFVSLYFPDNNLPVFAKTHLRHFIEALGGVVADQEKGNTVTLGLRLARMLAATPELRGWSNYELMQMLYRWNGPPPDTKLLKIAPGEDAEYWESDCLPQGMICVGWDDVGDLRKYPDFDAFRAAFEKTVSYNGHQGTITRKAKELWAIRDVEQGDLIAANHGTKEILAVGEVLDPGYVWDPSRKAYRHTVKVRWDLKRSGPIEPVKKWVNITVEKVTGDLRRTILKLNRDSSAAPTVSEDASPLPISNPMSSTNLILYGPPGTGKTYHLQQLQNSYTETPLAVDRNAWLDALVTDYGWRAVIAATIDSLGANAVPAIRDHELIQAKARTNKRERNLSQTIWLNLQQHTPETVSTVQLGRRHPPYIFTKSEDSIWSLLPEWQSTDDDAAKLAALYRTGQTVGAPPIKRFRQITFHPSFCYEDFVRGIRPVASDEDGRTEFRLVDGVFKQICDDAAANPGKRYALFIDEINRGNIAKIFGELITLIEPDKRLKFGADGAIIAGMTVQLPGGNVDEVAEAPFGVPANLDIYGTMNTADRSIALLDIALRRRFDFWEMEPRYDLLSASVNGINCAALLRRINDRLEYLLDRDHRIGHAYLMKAGTLEDLRQTFANQIIPLLQEYFFDDLSKVALTLSGPKGSSSFVSKETLHHEQLFPDAPRGAGSGTRERFVVTKSTNWSQADFAAIYTAALEVAAGEQAEST